MAAQSFYFTPCNYWRRCQAIEPRAAKTYFGDARNKCAHNGQWQT